MHILVCEEHKHHPENEELLQTYKQKCILRQPSQIPAFAKNIKLKFHSSTNEIEHDEKGIYMLQPIQVSGKKYTIFYDTGCGDFVSRLNAVKRLGAPRATKEFDGPIRLGGVGGISTERPHGIYSVRLPMLDGNEATMTGVCMNEITQEFPMYPLHGKVLEDIKSDYM